MNRTQIINKLISIYAHQTYLEIGVDDPKINFNHIECKFKIGVDPKRINHPEVFELTSDQFFKDNQSKFDCIFIDGLHHEEQVIKDIQNALDCLSDNGTIVVHDCNPTTKEMQQVPRIQGEWTGDVWKAWLHFRDNENLSMSVLDTDYGVGVIRRGKQKALKVENPTYEQFEVHKKEWLNLVPVELQPVSIVIPAYEQFGITYPFEELINSLFLQKGKFEVVVSDNSYDNNIKKICNNYPIRYYRNDKRGIAHNTNNALDLANYELIKIMYQDDKFLADCISDISFALKFNHWLGCSGHAITDRSKIYKTKDPEFTEDLLFEKNKFGMPSVMAIRKNDIRFDPELKTRVDCDYYYAHYKQFGLPGYFKKRVIGSRYWKKSTSSTQCDFTEKEKPYLIKKWM